MDDDSRALVKWQRPAQGTVTISLNTRRGGVGKTTTAVDLRRLIGDRELVVFPMAASEEPPAEETSRPSDDAISALLEGYCARFDFIPVPDDLPFRWAAEFDWLEGPMRDPAAWDLPNDARRKEP